MNSIYSGIRTDKFPVNSISCKFKLKHHHIYFVFSHACLKEQKNNSSHDEIKVHLSNYNPSNLENII